MPSPLNVPADAPEASSSVVVPTPLAVPMTVVFPLGATVTAPPPLTAPMKTGAGVDDQPVGAAAEHQGIARRPS